MKEWSFEFGKDWRVEFYTSPNTHVINGSLFKGIRWKVGMYAQLNFKALIILPFIKVSKSAISFGWLNVNVRFMR